MKIILQSGNSLGAIRAVQRAFAAARERLATVGVLYPQSCGSPGQADLWQASLARADTPDVQEPDDAGAFGARVRAALGAEIVAMRPKAMVLIVPEAALWCVTPPKLAAFRDLLADFSDDLHILLSMAPPPDALTDIFIEQIRLGRFADLSAEAAVAADPDGWWTTAGRMTAASADGPVVQGPVPAVDAAALENLWRGEFGGAILKVQIAPATPAGVAKLMAGLAELADVPKAHLNPSDAVIEPRPPVAALRRRMALNRALAAQGPGLAPISEADRRRLFDAAGGAGAALQPAMLASLTVGLATAKGKLPPLPDLSPPDDFDPAPIIAQVSRKVAAPAPAKAAVMPPSSHPTTRPKARARAPDAGALDRQERGAAIRVSARYPR